MKHDQEVIHNTIIQAISSKEEPFPELPLEFFLMMARPTLNRKAMAIREKRKQLNDRLILGAGYFIFLTLASLYVFEFEINGFSQTILALLITISGMSLIALCCTPLFVVLKNQLKERN